MNPMNLGEASLIARAFHEGQVDKADQPYYLHVFAVRDMLTGEDEEVQIAAVLHDVIEDTRATLEILRRLGCTERTLAAICSVTRQIDVTTGEKEPYLQLVGRARRNPDGRKIKLADNLHNTMRLGDLNPEVAREMAERYARARAILLSEEKGVTA